jgi:hypothetical protein
LWSRSSSFWSETFILHTEAYKRRLRLKRDGPRAETRFRLSPKRTSPFKSAGASVQSTAGSRGVRISVSNAGYSTFRSSVTVLATHSIRQFPLHFPSRASCAIRFQTHPTSCLYICPNGLMFAAVRKAVTLNVVSEMPHYTEQNENTLHNPNTHLCLTL